MALYHFPRYDEERVDVEHQRPERIRTALPATDSGRMIALFWRAEFYSNGKPSIAAHAYS